MKIGILTFHSAHNYGAVLQAYALQEYLKSCGNEVEVIDYRPAYLTRGYAAFPLPAIGRGVSFPRKILRLGHWGLRLPWYLARVSTRIKRRRGFENFISGKMNLSRERFAEGGVPETGYDAIVFGSDQIWSPAHTLGGDPIFLGDFPVSAGTLKIAYAASAGAASATLGDNPKFANALKNFDAVSVRESDLANALQTKTHLKIETVLDPTLLVDKSAWDKIAELPRAEKKYVLVYQVMYDPAADKIARELAAQLGAEVVSVWAGYALRGKMLKTETPEQFVGWFARASCVVSTSFHGTAFALINEKPLYYVAHGNAAENRPRQILRALGLESRIVSDGKTPRFSPIDYSEITGGGIALRERSRAFLSEALSRRKTP